MAVTNQKLIPYKERISKLLLLLNDSKLSQAQAMARLPQVKANIEKLIDTLLKSKEKVTDAIIVAEIDEIVKYAEEGLKSFGERFLANSLDGELPQLTQNVPSPNMAVVDELNMATPNTQQIKSVIEKALNGTGEPGLCTQNTQVEEEGFFVLDPASGTVHCVQDEALLKQALANFNDVGSLTIVKGKKVKIKYSIDIEL